MPRVKRDVEKTITKSSKTGKMVSKAEAKANPDTTFEMKVKVTPKPPKFTPGVGEFCLMNGALIKIMSLDPLEAVSYERLNGVQVTENYPIESLDGAEPITMQEVYERAF